MSTEITHAAERTYSLAEYAAILKGAGPNPDDPESVEPSKIKWLARRLRGELSPQLPGYKAGREWRATRAQIDEAIAILTPTRVPAVPQPSSMTATSRRRLAK